MFAVRAAVFAVRAAAFAVVPCALLVTGPAFADTAEPVPQRVNEDSGTIVSFQLENDLFAETDRHYTNGVRLSWLTPETTLPNWLQQATNILPFFDNGGRKRLSFSIGQNMYTPDGTSTPNPDPDDRPYAGFLYGTFGIVSDTGLQLDNLELTVGIIGPWSLAEQTQKLVHEIVGASEPQGWHTQLKNEPALMLTYERKWRGLYQLEPYGFGIDATPYVGGSVGNVFTQAVGGMMFRLGTDLPADYGPPRIRPSLPGSDFYVPTRNFGWYLFGGVEARLVAYNVFLDGNTFRDSPSVDKKWVVGDLQFGVAFTFAGIRLAYTHVFRTKEFDGQDGLGEFGAVTLGFRF